MYKRSIPKLTSFLIIMLFFILSCGKEDDTSAIRNRIKEGAELAEEHDIKGILKLTTEDLLVMPGRHDRARVKQILWTAFRHYGQLKVLYPEPGVDLSDNADAADARVYFMIVKRDRRYPELDELYKDPKGWLEQVGENADLYRLDLEFIKTGDGWIVKYARLEPFKGLGFDI